MLSLIPTPKHTIVERVKTPEKIGSIIIPGTVEEKKTSRGLVLSTKADKDVLPKVEANCYLMIYFSRYAGVEIETERDEKLLVVADEDILAYEIYKKAEKSDGVVN